MLIKKISQKDRFTFAIEWLDGLLSEFRLCDVQNHCPCIACREKRLHKEINVYSDVKAFRIQSVGRYALRIEFTSGCSKGIYPYSLLRRISK